MSQGLGFIHKYIPPKDPKSTQTLLLLHGTAGNEESLLPICDLISPDSAVLSPRGQILENGMPRFFRRHSEGVFDIEDLHLRTREMAKFIQDSIKVYNLDSNKFITAGYSNGANIASSLILTYPGLISEAALYHPMVPYIPDNMPELSNTRVLITAGTNDPIVSVDETNKLYDIYAACGASVEIFWHDMGHNLTREELYKTQMFFSYS